MDNRKLIEKVARKLGRDKGDVTKLLEAFTSIVTTRCSELDSIAIPGFGTFEFADTMGFKVSNVLKNKLKQK